MDENRQQSLSSYLTQKIGVVWLESTTRKWLLASAGDDVAVALLEFEKGSEICDSDSCFSVTLRQPIPFGHKFAIRFVPKGGLVHKYGQVIGVASCDIEPGDHVHVHNLESRRGRGDLAGGDES